MAHRSKSTLFLIEQLIVVAVFALCAVACVSIMVAAYLNANDSHSLSHALLKAESGAEVFKATGGDAYAIADMLGGDVDFVWDSGSDYTVVTVHYDSQWQVNESPGKNGTDSSYVLTIIFDTPEQTASEFNLVTGQLYITKDGGELVRIPLAARS